MRPKFWYQWDPTADVRARIEPIADIIPNGPLDQLPGVTAICIGNIIDANGELMDKVGPSLKVIARPGIGVDNVNIADASERGVLVINTPDAPTESTAEHAVALLMAVAKRVTTGHTWSQTRNGPRTIMLGTEMKGRTLGLLGFGRIGRRVGEICSMGLKMNVIVYDPYLSHEQAAAVNVTPVASMDDVLEQSDFVSMHTPYLPETHHMISDAQLSKMKPGSYLINASRGPILDEQALVRALESGHLGGAALDVFEIEPPEMDNPLLTMPNVVATPHTASYTTAGVHAMQHGVTDQLIQILNGEKPPFLVDPNIWPGRAG